jgi:predicted Rossmann-fold nucleotide-binding protein
MSITSLAVFCGSRDGIDDAYVKDAQQLGKLMARNNIEMIYGGGGSGLMGIVADTVMLYNGKVTGALSLTFLLNGRFSTRELLN